MDKESSAEKENGYWIASVEYNPLNPKIRTSVAVSSNELNWMS